MMGRDRAVDSIRESSTASTDLERQVYGNDWGLHVLESLMLSVDADWSVRRYWARCCS